MIQIQLLGTINILVDGQPLTGDAAQRRRIALLALLATPPVQLRGRDWLIGMLWPESDDDSARHLLSASVHVLRKALGPESIITKADSLGLNPQLITVDCVEFRMAIEEGRVDDAVKYYQGSFLDGFYVKNSSELEHWVDAERAEYDRLHREALKQAARERKERGDAEGAVAAWRALNALDPLDAQGVIALMDAMAAAGDRAGALRQAQVHAHLLEQELGAAADARVEARAEEIRHSDAVITPTAPSAFAVASAPAEAAVADLATEVKPPVVLTVQRARVPRFVWGAVLLLGLIGFWTIRAITQTSAALDSHTIAVLPFNSITGDPDEANLAEAMPEQILALLTGVEGTFVVPTSSTQRFGPAPQNTAQVGRELHAGYLVEGSLQKYLDSLRVWVKLVRVRDEHVVWAGTYTRPFADIFGIQDEIARAVARNTRQRLFAADLPAARKRTPAITAFMSYTAGSVAMAQRTPATLLAARDDFEQAILQDTLYADAYAALANTYTLLGSYDYGAVEPHFAFEKARTAALRALKLNKRLDMAYAALGNIYANYDWNFEGAERAFKEALRLNPRNSTAMQWYALLLAAHGRADDARKQMEFAARIDPTAPMVFVNFAHVLYYSRAYDAAAEQLDRALRLDPALNRAHMLYALIDLQRGRADRSVQLLMAAHEDEPTLNAVLTCALVKAGRMDEARRYEARLEAQAAEKYVAPELLALAAVALNERDQAFQQLDEALRRKSGGITYLRVEPLIDSLRSDPRFPELLRKAGMAPS